MRSKTIYQEMQRKSDRLWNSIFEHPFVLGIVNVTLA